MSYMVMCPLLLFCVFLCATIRSTAALSTYSTPFSSHSLRRLERGVIKSVDLTPFDIEITLRGTAPLVSSSEISDLVTNWLSDGLIAGLEQNSMTVEEGYASFHGIVLLEREDDKPQEKVDRDLYTAKFKGNVHFSVNETHAKPVTYDDVLTVQRVALIFEDELLKSLQASTSPSLGAAVMDVHAFLSTDVEDEVPETAAEEGLLSFFTDGFNDMDDMDLVLIVAVGGAALSVLCFCGMICCCRRKSKQVNGLEKDTEKPKGSFKQDKKKSKNKSGLQHNTKVEKSDSQHDTKQQNSGAGHETKTGMGRLRDYMNKQKSRGNSMQQLSPAARNSSHDDELANISIQSFSDDWHKDDELATNKDKDDQNPGSYSSYIASYFGGFFKA